ncbi:hypothetical protein H4CHR_01589 [Variovorax sp. PBS-H4]|uniref:hypothetical protein n=1 Tax=Variovorax sp. PBS-H4 TaxID=434008 RepID=UPI001316C3DA|nr:hypothetical protein [Variovorax sp. PBS-H4]VTU25414.1 hypothetical protein H4CHR_01589 [Variovorax sp. PBS-H4]
MTNPWALLAIVIAWGSSIAGAGWYGMGIGRDQEIAGQSKIKQAIEDTREAAQQGAAYAIAALKPVNTTIVQKVQREITQNTVYRDCRVPADGVQLANQAITGRSPEPSGGVIVPSPDASKR